MLEWVVCAYWGFLPHSGDMHVGLIGESNLTMIVIVFVKSHFTIQGLQHL